MVGYTLSTESQARDTVNYVYCTVLQFTCLHETRHADRYVIQGGTGISAAFVSATFGLGIRNATDATCNECATYCGFVEILTTVTPAMAPSLSLPTCLKLQRSSQHRTSFTVSKCYGSAPREDKTTRRHLTIAQKLEITDLQANGMSLRSRNCLEIWKFWLRNVKCLTRYRT